VGRALSQIAKRATRWSAPVELAGVGARRAPSVGKPIVPRAKHQPETRAYLERRIREGKTEREALRSLKRHISRELYHRLTAIPLTS
jgi:hypothetical protein